MVYVMKFMIITPYRGLIYSLILAACLGCSKENYLDVGKDAIVAEQQGMLLRSIPTASGKKIILVPFGKSVRVLAEGASEKLYGIKSKWYRVSYGRYEGWMWGGLANPKDLSGSHRDIGKCESLFDYADKTFKRVSVTPGPRCGDETLDPACGSVFFEQGVKLTTTCNCHGGSTSLELPGASFEDGFKILGACGYISNCEPLSFDKFRSANFDSVKLKGCKNSTESYSHFNMHRTGGRLTIEALVGGI